MKNTIFSIHKYFKFKDHIIIAEKRSLFYTMEYSLIIDNKKQDQIYGLYGILSMHGNLDIDGADIPVKIVMNQRIFTTKFYCVVEGKNYQMKDLIYEGF